MELLIVGGGPVGLAAALALRERGIRSSMTVLEAAPAGRQVYSDRNIALSSGSWRFLRRIGVALGDAPQAPITRVEVSQQGSFGLLTLDAADIGRAELGAAITYPALMSALHTAIGTTDIALRHDARVTALESSGDDTRVALANGECLRADGIIIADGAGGITLPGTRHHSRDSGHVAVLARVTASRPQPGLAIERFTAHGTLALVPRSDGDWTAIWAQPRADAERALALPDEAYVAMLNEAAGRALGTLTLAGARTQFPLVWHLREPRSSGSLVAIGNAAQGLHPAAAQGLNLGFADARVLASTMAACKAAPIRERFATFARRRAPDRLLRMGFSGLLAHGFHRGGWILDVPRGAGLMALQLATPARRALLRRLVLA